MLTPNQQNITLYNLHKIREELNKDLFAVGRAIYLLEKEEKRKMMAQNTTTAPITSEDETTMESNKNS